MTGLLLQLLLLQLSSSPPAGSIEGTIVDAVTRGPIKKAQVTLLGVPQAVPVASTDGSGHFAFRDVPDGAYLIQTIHASYPPAFGRSPGMTPVKILAGETKTLVLKMLPAASISGRVLDEDGDPLELCTVELLRVDQASIQPRLVRFLGSQSDDKGEYRIAAVPPGRYYLEAACLTPKPLPRALVKPEAAHAEPEMRYGRLFYPGSRRPDGASVLRLEPGAELRGIDFQMRALRVFSIRGRLTGFERPAPAEPALATLKSVSDGGFASLDRSAMEPVTPENTFVFRGVEPGAYRLEVLTSEKNRWYGAQTVMLEDEQPEELAVSMSRLPDLQGTLEIDGAASALPPEVNLFFDWNGTPTPFTGQRHATAAPDGQFVFRSPVPGKWRLRVESLPPGTYLKSVWLDDREVKSSAVDLSPSGGRLRVVIGTRAARVDVRLAQGDRQIEPIALCRFGELERNAEPVCVGVNTSGVTPVTGLAPGVYRFYAIGQTGAPMLLDADERATVNEHSRSVTLAEGEQASLLLPVIPPDASTPLYSPRR